MIVINENTLKGKQNMRILNIEDTPIKHRDIKNVLESCGITDVDCERTLEEGIKRYMGALVSGIPYDLIITDMWYPSALGASEIQGGDLLIEKATKEKWDVPIILCSNQNYNYPEILGTLHYSDNIDWEGQLRIYVESIKSRK